MTSQEITTAALKGAAWLFYMSIFQKCISMALTGYTLRSFSLTTSGALASLDLLYTTCLFFRDGFRLAVLRCDSSSDGIQSMMNIAYFLVSIGITWTCLCSFVIISYPPEENTVDDWNITIPLYTGAAIIEWIYEPLFCTLCYSKVHLVLRAQAEGISSLGRSITIVCLLYFTSLSSLVIYGVGQCIQSCLLLGFYAGQVSMEQEGRKLPLLFPRPLTEGGWSRTSQVKLCTVLFNQSIIKHGLTYGNTYLMTIIASYHDMGVYNIAFQLGSLVPRMIFLPLEESAKAIFSKILNVSTSSDRSKNTSTELQYALDILTMFMKTVVYLGIFLATFGPYYTKTLIYLYLGEEKSNTGISTLLGHYCLYIFFLAGNGILEAFVHSTASPSALQKGNLYLTFCFILSSLLTLGLLFNSYGTSSILIANAFNMILRILFGLMYVGNYFTVGEQPAAAEPPVVKVHVQWLAMIPSLWVMVLLGVSLLFLQTSFSTFFQYGDYSLLQSHLYHITTGLLVLTVVIPSTVYIDYPYFKNLLQFDKKKID